MQWLNSLVSEYEGKPLQKSGMLTKDQLNLFFQKSGQQFDSPSFKQMLRAAFRSGRSTEELVNGMQSEIFMAMGVQADFGLKCLSQVTLQYGRDTPFMRAFYEHVQKEEMILDEAEMPEAAFHAKYDTLNRFKAEMEERMAAMQGMSEEEQQTYMAGVFKEMIAQSGAMSANECCNNPHGCSHQPVGAVPGQAPPVVAAPPREMDAPGGPAGGHGGPGAGAGLPASLAGAGPGAQPALSGEQQMQFFASLAKSDGGR